MPGTQYVSEIKLDVATALAAAAIINPTQSVHTLTAGAPTDVTTITKVNAQSGDLLILRLAAGANPVTFQHGVANIRCPLGQDVTISTVAEDHAIFRFDGTNWDVVTAHNLLLTSSTLTIAAGVVTARRPLHLVDTEGAAAFDDLDTINGGQLGAELTIGIVNNNRVVVLTQAGNIRLAGARVRMINNTVDRVKLRFDGTNWVEIAVTNQSDGFVRRKSVQGPSPGVAGSGAFALTQSIPGGTLRVGDCIRVRALFRATVQPGATNTTYTVSYAGTVIGTTTAADLGVNGYAIVESDVMITATGAGGTYTSLGKADQRVTGAGAPTSTVQNTIGTAVDTTAASVVTANVTQDAADTSILEMLEVDFL